EVVVADVVRAGKQAPNSVRTRGDGSHVRGEPRFEVSPIHDARMRTVTNHDTDGSAAEMRPTGQSPRYSDSSTRSGISVWYSTWVLCSTVFHSVPCCSRIYPRYFGAPGTRTLSATARDPLCSQPRSRMACRSDRYALFSWSMNSRSTEPAPKPCSLDSASRV